MPHLSLPRTKLVVALLMGCATASAVEAPAKPGTTEANGMALCSMEAGAFATGAVAPVDIDPASNSGRTSIALHNLSTAPCRVILQPGRVVDAFTRQPLSVAASLQKQGESAGSPFVELPLPAQGSTAVQLVLTGYRWPGQSRADVDVNGRKVSVSASFLNVPFNVGLQSAGSETAKVALVRRRDGMVVLKNDDAYGYNVAWRLFTADDSTVLNGSKVLPPKSSAPIAISPPAGWFRHPFRGFFRNDERAGYLTLEFAPPGLTSNAMQTSAAEGGAVRTASALHLPAKALPVQFDLAYWDSAKALGPAIIGIVLVFGAVLSMVMNLWIPNYTTRSQLQQRLDRLSSEIRQFSMSSDSRLRVGLRMESLRLKEALGRTWVSSLGGADEMKQFSMEVDALERRIDVGRHLEAASARFDTLAGQDREAPPSALDQAAAALQSARAAIVKLRAVEADLDAAKAAITKAEERLDRLAAEDAAFAAELAARFTAVETMYGANSPLDASGSCQELRRSNPHLFDVLAHASFRDAAQIRLAQVHELDVSEQKLFILADFCKLADSIIGNAQDARNAALTHCRPLLLRELQGDDWRSLRRARRLVEQVREGVTSLQIEDALRAGNVQIRYNPATVHANEPVILAVHFTNPQYEGAAACRDFVCEWIFPSPVGSETGWTISHYFRTQEEADVKASFRTPDGRQIENQANQVVEVEPKPKIALQASHSAWLNDGTKVESLRLILALGLAVMGLVAGAYDQFMKLDVFFGLIAVLLLGFSADAIKNLFTRKT